MNNLPPGASALPRPVLPRRNFLQLAAGCAAGLAASNVLSAKSPDLSSIPLGLCNHSFRAWGWKAAQFLDYAAKLQLDGVLLNALANFENLEEDHLQNLRRKGEEHGIRFWIGAGGISRGVKRYQDTYGPPEDVINTGLRVARAVGSPVVNVRIGSFEDRYTNGGIAARMEESIKVLQAARTRIEDAGVKIGFENHAADMRSEELLELVKAVGTDICGVMLDPGNAVWAMEDPMEQLKLLGPYTICTSLRDYQVWAVEDGAMFQWSALGDGLMDVRRYAETLAALAPGAPIHIETISNEQRPIPFLTARHMEAYPNLPYERVAAFLKLVRRGQPLPIQHPAEGVDPREFDRGHQKYEFDRSIAYLRDVCGVGRKV